MADKGPGSTSRSGKKRLARAKIKETEHGIKSSKGRAAAEEAELSKAEQKKARKQKITAIAVGAFAVIMALSMMLPSLTYIFGNNDQGQTSEQQQDEQSTETEQADDESTDDEQTPTGMEAVDANYAAVVDPLEAKLEDSPDDLATILNLGNHYMSWASAATSYATDDDTSAHVEDLYGKAIEYFDRYLELNDSAVVKSNRAMCELYLGDADQALKDLRSVTKKSPEYGPAWANIGMIQEYLGKTDEAKEAYQKAVEADPDDEYGSKSYANRRLAAIAASENGELTDEASEATSGTTAEGAEALEDALGSGL